MRHLLACAALVAAMPAWADGQIQVDYADVYYDVRGTTDRAIADDMERQSLAVGKQYFAEATWAVRWHYDDEQSVRGVCRVKALRIQLIQRATLPRWNAAGAPAELAARWDRFMTALRIHERDHTDHGRQAAEEISRTLGAMRATDCALLRQKTSEKGNAIIARHAEADRQYDKATQHGRTQGAYWTVALPVEVKRRTVERPPRPTLEAMPVPALPER